MTKLQIAAVAAALGLGILAQIPERDHDELNGHDYTAIVAENGVMAAANQPTPEGLLTALLNIEGMT